MVEYELARGYPFCTNNEARSKSMGTLDYCVFVGYLAVVLALGVALGARRGGAEYFLAGRRMGAVPIGLSVMVTAFSAINFNAFPTEVFANGLYVVISLPVFVIIAFPVTRIFMPFYHGMRLTSAYEYLERRFDAKVRSLGSGLFILWRVMWMAVTLFASGQVLSAVTGLDLWLLVITAGAVATIYTALGGMRAVMWTDVAQFVVLFGSIAAAVILAGLASDGGLRAIVEAGAAGGRLAPARPFDPSFFSPDPRIRITFWSGLIGTFVAFMARYGADQVVLQRYFTARSLSQARRGFWINVVAVTFALVLLVAFGLAVYAHAAATGGLAAAGKRPVDHLAALVAALPAGLTGLVGAGLLAATMSSIDSGINACSAAWVTDFHERFFSRRAPGAVFDGLLTGGLGAAAVALSFAVSHLGGLFAVANRVINGLGAPLLAIMVLGMFSRRVNAAGMFAGGIIGAAASVAVSFGVEGLALHYYAVANFALTAAACWAASLAAATMGMTDPPERLEWTWRARRGLSGRAQGGS